MDIIEGMNVLGVPGSIIAIIICVVIAAELVKSTQDLWSFLAARYLGFKTQYTKKKEREQMVYKNKEDLDNFINVQEAFNTKMSEDMNKLHDLMEDVSDSVIQMRISTMRSTILEFASESANGKIATKEQYKYIFKLYEQYEAETKKRKIKNDEVTLSIEILRNIYNDRLRKQSFIEDRITDPVFQERVRELLDRQQVGLEHND